MQRHHKNISNIKCKTIAVRALTGPYNSRR